VAREIQIPFEEISDSQTITQVNESKFKEQGLDMHRHEVEKLEDDHSKKKRVLRIKNTKYFGPWSHRG
jgi:hypothetical protein